MYGRKRSVVVSFFLRVLSLVYGIAVFLRQSLYSTGIAKQRKINQPVVSVGNLTLGGTGKTPMVIHIAALLMKRSRRPAIVSRGYGRQDESALLVVSDGSQVLVDSALGGDEPVLIASAVPGLPVVVCRDRFEAGVAAHERFASDIVILDDGFQHIRLKRDLDIVLIDAADPFGNRRLFPAGILREPVSALKRADAVVITGSDRAADLEPLKRTIAAHTDARLFTSRLLPKNLVEIMTGRVMNLDALQGAEVLALCGIARPASFLSVLGSLGAVVKEQAVFPDHYEYTGRDLANLFRTAADHRIGMIVTTEKDAVRLKRLRPEGIWALRVELVVAERETWESLLLGRL